MTEKKQEEEEELKKSRKSKIMIEIGEKIAIPGHRKQ